VITAEIIFGSARRKFIPLLRRGEWKEAAPSWLLGSVYLDFRNDSDQLEESYTELLMTLHRRRETAPPVGSSPPFPPSTDKNCFLQTPISGLRAKMLAI
jgi:hypothetical protein